MVFNFEKYYQVIVLLVMLRSSTVEAATNGLQPDGTQCVCIGDRLIYNCSVMGGTATLWRGTAFDCPLVGSEITLRHSQFASNQAFRACNNGDIIGSSIGVENGCYTSQLNVTIRASLNNRTVQCAFTSSAGTSIISESLLSVISETNLPPPPDNIHLADAQPGKLTFNWTSSTSNSSTLQYDIASDCGTCPTVANMTTATCSNLQVSTNTSLCHFRVSTLACNLAGFLSPPTAITLKVPNMPQVEIVPSYSNDSQALKRLFIITTMNQTEDHFYISDNISGSPTSYTAHTFHPVSGVSFNSTVGLASCEEGDGCPIELPRSIHCSQSTVINVSISAANKLGNGLRSNPFMIECTNNFVKVVYRENTTELTISCVFLNQSDVSEKACCVTYHLCDEKGLEITRKCNEDSTYSIKLGHSSTTQTYCYSVEARNDTYTVKVEGTLNFASGNDHQANSNAIAITVGVVVSIVLLLLGTGAIIIVFTIILTLRVHHRDQGSSVLNKQRQPQDSPDEAVTVSLPRIPLQTPLKQCLKSYDLPKELRLHQVDRDCEVREFIRETLSVKEFKRGRTYYEFTNEVENVQEGKEVLLQHKKTEKWFQLVQSEVLAQGLKLYGEGIARTSFGDSYRVFIQSFGSGARHLPSDSWILYNYNDQKVEPDVLQLVQVCSDYFAHQTIELEEGCTVKEFCTKNGLKTKAFNIFLNLEYLPEGMIDQPPHDVILMDKDNTPKLHESKALFTGPLARSMLSPRNGSETRPAEDKKWKAFALPGSKKESILLKKGSEVLYQDSRYQSGNYAVLDVDQDCVRMSKFIESKLSCQFEDGKAFYEATGNEEDLLYCKKMLRPQIKELGQEELRLESLIEYFYAIDGVPAKAVKVKDLQHRAVFIQSTSQGSRFLKKGEKILYLKEYINVEANPQADEHPDDPEGGSAAESGSNQNSQPTSELESVL